MDVIVKYLIKKIIIGDKMNIKTNEFGNEQYSHSIKKPETKHLLITLHHPGPRKGTTLFENEHYLCVWCTGPTPEKVARNPPEDVTCKNCIREMKKLGWI